MEIVCQDFFLEFLILNGELTLFIKLSELNKSLYEAVKKYKSHTTIWSLLCKRDFKEWMPDNDDQWLFHFPNLKPGNHFGLYCYFDGVLNDAYTKKYSDKKESIQTLTLIVPLYFALKKYSGIMNSGIMNKDFLSIRMSTRKIAFFERKIDETKETFTLKEFFNWDCRRVTDETLSPFLTMDQELLFSYAICQKENCEHTLLFKKVDLCSHIIYDGIHFRDEDNCSPCEDYVMTDKKYVDKIIFLGVSKTFGFEASIAFCVSMENYKTDSDIFKKNKICSLA